MNYLDQFPFLEFYNEFRHEFIKIKRRNSKYKYLEVELIKEISLDLMNQLEYANIQFLKYFTMKIYLINITYNILDLIQQGFLSERDELINILQRYQLKNLEYMKTYLSKEMNMMEDHYNFLYNNKKPNDIMKRTYSFIENAFQINY